MRRKLLRMLAFVLCVSMLFAFQIHAENPGDSGIMPLWDYAGACYCDVFFTEFEVGIADASVASRYDGGVAYGKLTLYRVGNWLTGDTLVNFWEKLDYDFVDFSETFIPDDGKTYKLVLEGTVTYDGYVEPVYLEDIETYHPGT